MNLEGSTYSNDEPFSEAEHHLLGMKVSNRSENQMNGID
jgi:hypothetical protein